ncbi:hypothetical protein COB57_04750 [Candidatus Peregrinibacteria bacterium]|nr:MAG: hypothetical protein COB57_04750 [Candidatus Peregrinibacteria bacterium]
MNNLIKPSDETNQIIDLETPIQEAIKEIQINQLAQNIFPKITPPDIAWQHNRIQSDIQSLMKKDLYITLEILEKKLDENKNPFFSFDHHSKNHYLEGYKTIIIMETILILFIILQSNSQFAAINILISYIMLFPILFHFDYAIQNVNKIKNRSVLQKILNTPQNIHFLQEQSDNNPLLQDPHFILDISTNLIPNTIYKTLKHIHFEVRSATDKNYSLNKKIEDLSFLQPSEEKNEVIKGYKKLRQSTQLIIDKKTEKIKQLEQMKISIEENAKKLDIELKKNTSLSHFQQDLQIRQIENNNTLQLQAPEEYSPEILEITTNINETITAATELTESATEIGLELEGSEQKLLVG